MPSIALTGNIASGKSHIAEIFRSLGAVAIDSDKIAHNLLENDAQRIIERKFGTSNRSELGKIVFGNDEKLKELENILHPLVRSKYQEFLSENADKIAIVEIPLLYETGADKLFDYVVFVDVSEEVQKKRALARPGMTEEKLKGVLARQNVITPAQKRQMAHFVVDNNDRADTVPQIKTILGKLCAK